MLDLDRGHLLVVDDNEMNRDLLSRRLRKKGHQVQVAEGGAEALEMIQSEAFDLILLDIMMPVMNGFEVLEKIREKYDSSGLPVIMATAKTESEDIVAALKIGANDYVIKPFDFPVVLARVHTQLALKKGRDALAQAHRRMKRDLEAAAAIQQTLLPAEKPEVPGARCVWRYVPCDELAGDTLNVIRLDEKTTGLFVLDVSGHGVSSSLLSVTLTRLMSGVPDASSVLWKREPGSGEIRAASPLEVADELSRQFPCDEATRQYFTLVYGMLDADSRILTYVSAGHPPMIQLRQGSVPMFHRSTGLPIALVPDNLTPSVIQQAEVSLDPGDRLYLYSDGIPEARSSDGGQYGEARTADTLQSCMDRSLAESIDFLLGEVWEWAGGKGPDDDVSILAIEIEG
jgi:sigma-B regulation protein RsbU (phosphoserine phosphatase)